MVAQAVVTLQVLLAPYDVEGLSLEASQVQRKHPSIKSRTA